MIDISIVITAHREGIIMGPTLRSARDAIAHVQTHHSCSTETILVLDRANFATCAMAVSAMGAEGQILFVDAGDPGGARNCGVRAARGKYIAFLDADDLWSFNWLTEAFSAAERDESTIWHSECNVTFGDESNIWWHVDSCMQDFSTKYLEWGNYWDAMSFSSSEIYRNIPFRQNDLLAGFGHEDWDWNRITLMAGYHHRPVDDTIHFKRRRVGSQMSRVSHTDSLVRPDPQVKLSHQGVPVDLVIFGNVHAGSLQIAETALRGEVRGVGMPHRFARLVLSVRDGRYHAGIAGLEPILCVRNPIDYALSMLVRKVGVNTLTKIERHSDILNALVDCDLEQIGELDAAMRIYGDAVTVASVDRPSDQKPIRLIRGEYLRIIADSVLDEVECLARRLPQLAEAWLEEIKGLRSSEEQLLLRTALENSESLGDNCEFGFFQRYEGLEPNSLLRWAVTPINDLIKYLRSPTPVFVEENLALKSSDLIYDEGTGFYFHTELIAFENGSRRLVRRDENWDASYENENGKHRHLSDKFFKRLKYTPTIYFVKSNEGIDDESIFDLGRALHEYNDQHLLIVVESAGNYIFRKVGRRIFKGTISKFADYESANVIVREDWLRLLRSVARQPEVRLTFRADQ